MAQTDNLPNAIMIIAVIYFLFNEKYTILVKIGLNLLIIFSLLSWSIFHQTKETKELLRLQTEQISANIKNLNAATAIALGNTKLIMKRLKE